MIVRLTCARCCRRATAVLLIPDVHRPTEAQVVCARHGSRSAGVVTIRAWADPHVQFGSARAIDQLNDRAYRLVSEALRNAWIVLDRRGDPIPMKEQR